MNGHDIVEMLDCSVRCSCGLLVAGSSLEDAKHKHTAHFGISSARASLRDPSAAESSAPAAPSSTPHCAGRLAVAHNRTPMVGGRCPICGEMDLTPCRVVIGEQRGESVECGAVEAIHGDALGMVGGHLFQGGYVLHG